MRTESLIDVKHRIAEDTELDLMKPPVITHLQASAQRAMLSGGSLGKAIGSATLRFASLLLCVEKEEKKLEDIG